MFNDSIGMNHRLRLIKFYTTCVALAVLTPSSVRGRSPACAFWRVVAACGCDDSHNPAKLGEVDTILAKYQGREVKLFTALNRRYNVEQYV